MDEPERLTRLMQRLKEKLDYTRKLIAEYEETMDYASHCNLLGFAEGIEFTLDEIAETMKEKGKSQGKSQSKGRKRNSG